MANGKWRFRMLSLLLLAVVLADGALTGAAFAIARYANDPLHRSTFPKAMLRRTMPRRIMSRRITLPRLPSPSMTVPTRPARRLS